MNFLARAVSLVLSPTQAKEFMQIAKAEIYSDQSTVQLWQKWISDPVKRRAINFAANPNVSAFANTKVGSALVGVGCKTIGFFKGIPAGTGSFATKIGNVAENSVGPALLSGAETVEQVGNCTCAWSLRQFLAQQIVCWGRHWKRAPGETVEVWQKLKTGTLTWSEVGTGTIHAGYIAIWGITPYTLISVTLANPAYELSQHEHAHH